MPFDATCTNHQRDMNTHLMDAYDLSGAVDRNSSQASLNEEVSQVVGQLGKLWGGFRKQVRRLLLR